MTDPPLLTPEMLECLEDHWRRQGAPIAESLRPGRTENEMEELLGPLGLRLPHEARMWWGWHDGASGERSARAIGPPVAFVPLASAVEMYEELRTVSSRVADDGTVDADELWNPDWFPLVASQPQMAADCGVTERERTSIHAVDFEFFEDSAEPVAESLGTVVAWWIRALDQGAWVYDRGEEHWAYHPERRPDVGGPTFGWV